MLIRGFLERLNMSESDTPSHQDEFSEGIVEQIKRLPDGVRAKAEELYLEFREATDDNVSDQDARETRAKNAKHDLEGLLNAQHLKEEVERQEAEDRAKEAGSKADPA
jgi:hypothetical protein